MEDRGGAQVGKDSGAEDRITNSRCLFLSASSSFLASSTMLIIFFTFSFTELMRASAEAVPASAELASSKDSRSAGIW